MERVRQSLHMAPLAIGTDLGGSIRILNSFNNLVGLRPTPGRIPYPTDYGWDTSRACSGPMVGPYRI